MRDFCKRGKKISISFGCCCVQRKEKIRWKLKQKENPDENVCCVLKSTRHKNRRRKKIHTSFNSGVDGGKLEHKKKKEKQKKNNMKIITHFELNEHENCKDNDNNNNNNGNQTQRNLTKRFSFFFYWMF